MESRDSGTITKDRFYYRKDESLGLLCTKFLRIYNREGVQSIGLDDSALQLGVERRRIYDIVNILEGNGVLRKSEKNKYTWKGFGAVPEAFEMLKEQGQREDLHTYITNISGPHVSNQKEHKLLSVSKTENKCSSDKEHSREKSLGLLTQNFVKLSLCSEVDVISLGEAALALLGDAHDSKAMRTKSRQLYDVANVFSSMGLIEKVHDPESSKPAFRWISIGRSRRNESSIALDAKNCKRRVFGANITNDTSVKKSNTKASNEQHQKYGSKRFVFGPFSPNVTIPEGYEIQKDGQIQNWDDLFCAHRPQYNRAVGNLFHHYGEAWSYWRGQTEDKKLLNAFPLDAFFHKD